MSFSSLQEFVAMGGHGLYVWLAYGAALIIVAYNVISVRVRQRRALQHVRDRARRHRAAQAAGTPPQHHTALATGDADRP